MLRTRSVANSSKQPTCTPAMMVIFSPASIGISSGAEKCKVRSISPLAINFACLGPASDRCSGHR